MHLLRSMLVVAALAAPAAAQPVPQAQLPNLLSTSVGGTVDLRFDYSDFDTLLLDDVTLIAFNLHVQYLAPRGFGGYLQVPFAYASANDESETELGNLQLGGLYAIRSSPTLDILLRGGIALDTASEDGELLVPFANILPRLADFPATGFDTSWLRLGGQLRYASGNLRIGGTLGFDLPLDSEEVDGDTVLTLGGSIGFEQPGGFGAALGLMFLQNLGDDVGDDNTVGLNLTGGTAIGSSARLFGAIGLNLEDDAEGFSVGIGVRFGF
jgi:hypothetical protein